MRYLHKSHHVVHKDIKPENVLLSAPPPESNFDDHFSNRISTHNIIHHSHRSNHCPYSGWLRRKVGTNSPQDGRIFGEQSVEVADNLKSEKKKFNVRRSEECSVMEFELDDDISNCTEDFLWRDQEIEEHETSGEGIGEEDEHISSREFEEPLEDGSSNLNFHVHINNCRITTEEKFGLLVYPPKDSVEDDSVKAVEFNRTYNPVPNSYNPVGLSHLNSFDRSHIFCFCCGMRTVEERIRANRQWEFDDGVSDRSGDPSCSHTPDPTACNDVPSHSPPVNDDKNRFSCFCCSRPVDILVVDCCNHETIKRRKIDHIGSSSEKSDEKNEGSRGNDEMEFDEIKENVLVKLIDFNSAVQTCPPDLLIYDAGNLNSIHSIISQISSSEGSRHFTPPECFSVKDGNSNSVLGQPRDIWSVGCLLYTLVCGELPFQ